MSINRPSWVELTTPDPEAAATFYGELFGWKHRAGLFLAGDSPVAGVTAGPQSGWTTFIDVADLAATTAKVRAAGGPPSADQAGTAFAVRTAGAPTAYTWGELITDDVEASAAFYGAVFGWTVEGSEGRREWLLDGQPIAGLLPRPPGMPAGIPAYWDVWFPAADPGAATARAAELGGTTLMPATATDHGVIAVSADPFGAVFTVVAR